MPDSKDRFTGKMFTGLWVPAMISSIGWALSDIADAIVVGQRLGATGLAAISLILPVYMVNCMFAHSLGLGGSVRYSKLLGEGKEREAVASFNRTIQVSVLISLLIAVLGNVFINLLLSVLGTTSVDGMLFSATRAYLRTLISGTPLFFLSNILNYYLRNDNNQKLASAGSLTGNLCDIALNILFVLVLDWGTGGAALATLIGQVIAVAVYLPGIFKKAKTIRIAAVRYDLNETLSCFKAGFATSMGYLLQLVFLLLCNNVLARISGETGIAVFDMIQNISYLLLYLYEGTARALQPLASTYHGERYEQGKKSALRFALLYGCTVGSCLILFVELFPGAFCRLFGIYGTSAQALGESALKIYAAGAFFAGISILISNYFQACEREREASAIVILRGAVVLLPCTMLFSMFDVQLFWWLFPLTEVVSLLLYLLYLRRRKNTGQELDGAKIYNRTITGQNDDITRMTAEIGEFCDRWQANAKQAYFVTMTVEEICLAIVKGGFENIKEGYIQLTLIAMEDRSFEIHIRDNATSFNPFSLDTAKADHDGGYDIDAMGMLVIKQKTKEFFYRRYHGFNTLVVKV